MTDAPGARSSQVERPATGGGASRRWLVEAGPIVVTLLLVWAKLVYLSAFVQSEWWSNEPSIGRWMRPTLDLLGAVSTNPQIATATLACLLIALGPVALVPRGVRLPILLAANLALTLLGLADLLHVRFYGDVLSASSFTTPRMVRDVLPSILDLAKVTDPIYAVDIVLGLALLRLYGRAARGVSPLGIVPRARFASCTLLSGLVLILAATDLAGQDDALFAPSSPRIEAAAVTGLLPYHLLELARPRRADAALAVSQVERVRRLLEEERRQKGSPSPLFGAARGANVILISAESLQAFPIGLVVEGQPVTPRLSAFARESLYFTNYHEQTYLGTTSDAQFGVLQSLYPQPVGFVAMDYADRDFRALPTMLAERGYATLATVAAPGEFWNAEKMHARYGFQRSYFEDAYALTEFVGPWLSDRAYFDQTLPILERQAEPFMAELLTSSNHHPFELPARYRTLDVGRLEGTLLGDYLQSVHLYDQVFGEFVDRLRASGLLDRSMVVMYGDHQAFLGDPPELGELLGRQAWGEYDRFRTRKLVPLFIRLPHGAHAGDRAIVGGHVDVAPTVLSLLGVEPERIMLGRDLTRERPSLVVFRDGSFADDTHYYVQRLGAAVSAVCYATATGQPVDCEVLESARRAARERLEASDAIVQGNLIPSLLGD